MRTLAFSPWAFGAVAVLFVTSHSVVGHAQPSPLRACIPPEPAEPAYLWPGRTNLSQISPPERPPAPPPARRHPRDPRLTLRDSWIGAEVIAATSVSSLMTLGGLAAVGFGHYANWGLFGPRLTVGDPAIVAGAVLVTVGSATLTASLGHLANRLRSVAHFHQALAEEARIEGCDPTLARRQPPAPVAPTVGLTLSPTYVTVFGTF